MDYPCELVTGGRYVCTPGWRRDVPVVDDCHRYYFPRRGQGRLWAAGRWHIIRPGRVYLIPGHQPVAYQCARRLELDWLHFRLNAADAEAALAQLGGVQAWPTRQWSFWRPTYTHIDQAMTQRPRQLIDRLGAMILYYTSGLIAEQLDAPRRSDSTPWFERLRPAVDFMDRRFRDNPSLAQVAAHVHLSPIYFHRRFREILGVSPHAYMLRRRMQLARQLIEQRDGSIKQIAAGCGYDSAFYFSRAFKRHFAVSPRAMWRSGTVQP
ncbi:MAG: AraC family transcriptional regulator [Phycisphaeraceae bacterium]